jgi:hypothetical protein
VILQHLRFRKGMLVLFLVVTAACSGKGCGGCRRAETCDECVQRCLDTQGGSPEVCRGSACASTPPDADAKFPACRPIR